jgi:hypothetical protein
MSYTADLRESAAGSDAAFAEYLTEGQLVFPRHLREASAFAETHAKGLVLEPRGHAKTTLFIYRAARRIGVTEGRRRLGILTAVDEDAADRSRHIRAIVEQGRFAEVFGWAARGVVGKHWTDDAWTVRGAEGALGKDATCRAMSLRSVRAGARLDDLLADDMVGPQENDTQAGREKASRTYWSVVDRMVVPGGSRWFLGTRWHEDDIYGELIRKGWPKLVRKAIQDDGTALWPELYPLEGEGGLRKMASDMGSAIFDLQMQNDPSGLDGNIFQRDTMRWVDAVPAGERRIGVDLASSTKERADYTAVVEIVEDSEHNIYIVGAWREHLEAGHRAWLTGRTDSMEPGVSPTYGHDRGPRLLWPATQLPERWLGTAGPTYAVPRVLSALNIEAVAFQSSFTHEILNSTRLPARSIRPDRDKVTRARALAARMESGKVFFLRGGPGLGTGPSDPGILPREMLAFPNGDHDDLVDGAVYGADLGGLGNDFYFTAARR